MGDFTRRITRPGKRASEIKEGEFPPFEFAQDTSVTADALQRFHCDEVWVSGRYTVYVRRDYQTGWSRLCDCDGRRDPQTDHTAFDDCPHCEGTCHRQLNVTHLSIKRNDRESVHDWRDLQIIKNVFCGDEAEGIEIYPAESRLTDTANQYHLWVFPPGEKLPVGFQDGRLVTESPLGNGKQRPFEVTPKDAVNDAELQKMAIVYCESKAITGKAARDILGRDPTDSEIRAVYEDMGDDDLSLIIDRFSGGLPGIDPDFVSSRLAMIRSIMEERHSLAPNPED